VGRTLARVIGQKCAVAADQALGAGLHGKRRPAFSLAPDPRLVFAVDTASTSVLQRRARNVRTLVKLEDL
jgi:hypothetical protein